MVFIKNKAVQICLVFILALALFVYKLDYTSFFTDEILYVDSGREYLIKNDFTMNLQHPFIAKYIAGIASLRNDRDVFLMRLPFAFIGACSAVVVFLIALDWLELTWALVATLLFLTYPFIFDATRMTMMESPMHLFWLLAHLSFLRYLKKPKIQNTILTGVFLGLSISTKFTSAIFFPFTIAIILIYSFSTNKKLMEYKTYLVTLITAAIVVGTTYIPLILKRGLYFTVTDVLRANKDTILNRNSTGKIHVVGNRVYDESPWWFYFYYIFKAYSLPQVVITFFGIIANFIKKSFFGTYWLTFLGCNTVLFWMMTLKNARYISSMEIALIFLTTLGLKIAYEKLNNKFAKILIATILTTIIIFRAIQIINMQPTLYNALYKYINTETQSFSNGKRTFILGSIRSSRWYFANTPEDLVVSRKDFDVIGKELKDFDYLAIDENEYIKNSDTTLQNLLELYANNYEKVTFPGLVVYKKL
jgi:4-amino-4-deoxy-L-arabinose transferase-like glycosyltransferase